MLHIIDLNFNAMTGSIPVEIYDIPFLFQLDLNDNLFSGTIATEIGSIQFLQFVQLEGNELTGTIPSEMGDLKFLKTFEAYNNKLMGSMPEEVCANRNQTVDDEVRRLQRLTVDCNVSEIFFVNCSVPECCTSCQ
uniref:Uncharacterized protein n=1 Tax=Ditylum brightwellii TaxID=49249 RepID=A0A7S4SN96_9STRA